MSPIRKKGGEARPSRDREEPAMNPTPGDSVYTNANSALAKAVSLHLEGRSKEALKELDRALESGERRNESYPQKGGRSPA